MNNKETRVEIIISNPRANKSWLRIARIYIQTVAIYTSWHEHLKCITHQQRRSIYIDYRSICIYSLISARCLFQRADRLCSFRFSHTPGGPLDSLATALALRTATPREFFLRALCVRAIVIASRRRHCRARPCRRVCVSRDRVYSVYYTISLSRCSSKKRENGERRIQSVE